MAIQLPTSLVITSSIQTFDSVWIRNIQIQAPSPTQPVRANITICPFNSVSGSMNTQASKNIVIPDVMAAATTDSNVAQAMTGIFAYVQNQVTSQSLF